MNVLSDGNKRETDNSLFYRYVANLIFVSYLGIQANALLTGNNEA